MLIIETEVKPSEIHGLGLFTLEDVKKGQLIWKHYAIIDQAIPKVVILSFPELVRDHMFRYTWRDDNGDYLISLDNDKFMNHSVDPNIEDNHAIRDIKAGEELTCDYKMVGTDYQIMKIPEPDSP